MSRDFDNVPNAATIEMSPNLEVSTGGQIGKDSDELQGVTTGRGIGKSRKRRTGGIEDRRRQARHRRQLLFEQFKENLSLATEFTVTARDGLRSAPSAWRKATPEKRAVWLLVPTVLVVSAVAEHFSVPWYYEPAVLVVVGLGSRMRRAMRRKLS